MFRRSLPTSYTVPTLDPAPPVTFRELSDKDLLARMDGWGRLGKVALRRFVSGLPEVARRDLFRRRRCGSIFEYAAKVAELSREVVSQILVLHTKIGQYRELWGLLAEGCVGWTNLARIADFVTPQNVLWWARIVQEAPRHVLERLVSQLKQRQAADTSSLHPDVLSVALSETNSRCDGLRAGPDEPPAPSTGSGSQGANFADPGSPPGRQAASHSVQEGLFGAAESRSTRAAIGPDSSATGSHVGRSDETPSQAGETSGRAGETSDHADDGSARAEETSANACQTPVRTNETSANACQTPARTNETSVSADQTPATSPGDGEVPVGRTTALPLAVEPGMLHAPVARARRTSVEFSAICDSLIQRMLEEYRRRGITMAMGELIEHAIVRLWRSGELPLPPGFKPQPETLGGMPAEQSGNTAAEPSGDAAAGPSGGMAERASAGQCSAGACRGGIEREPLQREPQHKSIPISAHKILAVVISVAETGESWMRTHNGIVPIRLADLGGLAPVVEVVKLGELHSRLAEKAAVSKTMPVSGRLYVAAVSGGKCQRKGCNNPATHIHHLIPPAEGGGHGPDNSTGLCERCHAERHDNLIANPFDHPSEWTSISPEQRPDATTIDRAYQRIKREARASGFRVA